MLKIDSYNDNTYDYICNIVGTFLDIMEFDKESLTEWIQEDANLSQDPTATVSNVRLLTTVGTVDLYFYNDASDPDIPDAPSFYLLYYSDEKDSCLLFSIDGDYHCYINFNLHSAAEDIETVIPEFSLRIYNALL